MLMFREVRGFVAELYRSRAMLFALARRNFQKAYMGSYLGFVWVFLQPLLFIGVLYTIFTFGFRAEQQTGVPFGLFLLCGVIVWLFFSGNFSANTKTIRDHSFLLTKVDFRLSILPLVGILSSAIPHLFFIGMAVLLAWVSGYPPSIYTIQVFYYFMAMVFLLMGLGWLTSSTNVFVPDVANIVAVFIQFGFWLTPIFWTLERFPERYQWVLKLNPLYYIVTGYRDSILNHTWFWERPADTIYFWLLTLTLVFFGAMFFRRLKPQFAEVI